MDKKGDLEKEIAKKITTTMIGSISDIEEFFGVLWDGQDSKEKVKMRQLFEKLREKILDRGNNQIRSIKKVLDNYEIKPKTWTIVMPVKERK